MEENETYIEKAPELVEPYNPTDPIVVFDPTMKKSIVVKNFIADSETSSDIRSISEANVLNIEGVKIPIISLNNSHVEDKDILQFKLSLKDFLPTLELKIYDQDGRIKAMDVPGMENSITVVLISPIDGANKKISIDFYIDECNFNDDHTIDYKGVMKVMNLFSPKNQQLGSDKLSTYEMFEEIAKENELGFAATEDCKDIEDKRWRQLYRQTYIDYIKEQLTFAGKDDHSVFDAWVDQYGYLVLVNVPWVFNYELNYYQLTIKTVSGINTGNKIGEENNPVSGETLRLLSNSKFTGYGENLRFTSFQDVVNNNAIKDGTKNKYFYMKSLCEENKIESVETEYKEFSLDGNDDENTYSIENIEFIGFDMTDDDDEDNTPIIVQQKTVQNFFNQIYNKSIIVRMPKPNYLLQRGMLVLLDIEEYNSATKKAVIENASNAYASQSENDDDDTGKAPEDPGDVLEASEIAFGNYQTGIMNFAKFGLYYIKDITFLYEYGNEEIVQEMTLVKRGLRNNLNNKLSKLTIS